MTGMRRRRRTHGPTSSPGWPRTRGEDPNFLGQRWDRFQQVLAHRDLWDKRDMRAFLLTPREEFVTKANLGRAYEWHYLDIGYGVTITGPHTVARMTNSIDVQFGDKVLEIGTGSGYQSAYLSNLTDKVWSIEIIKPLAERTRAPLRRADRIAATPNTRRSRPGTRTATTAGRKPARSTRSSSPAASITFRRRCCSSSSRTASW